MDGTAVPNGGMLEGDGGVRWKHEREKERGTVGGRERERKGRVTAGHMELRGKGNGPCSNCCRGPTAGHSFIVRHCRILGAALP